MKIQSLQNEIIKPKYLEDAVINGFYWVLSEHTVEMKIDIYHSVKLTLEDLMTYFYRLGFRIIDWDEDEWYDFSTHKVTYLTVSVNKDHLKINGKLDCKKIEDITHIKCYAN